MSLPWVQVEKSFRNGRAFEVAMHLGVSRNEIVGAMIGVWAWCLDHKVDGQINCPNAADLIESYAEWKGRSGAFVEAILHFKLAARSKKGIRIKGMDRYTKALLKNAKEADRKRLERQQKRLLLSAGGLSTGDGRPSDIQRTAPRKIKTEIEIDKKSSSGLPDNSLKSKKLLAAQNVPPDPHPERPLEIKSENIYLTKAQLVVEMKDAFFRIIGSGYEWGGRDESDLDDLLKKHDPSEIQRRWIIGLEAPYTKCRYISELRSKWNYFGKSDLPATIEPLPTYEVESAPDVFVSSGKGEFH